MPEIKSIRLMYEKGESISAIAKKLNLDRKTVRKYVNQTDFSPSPPKKQKRKSKLDQYEDVIRGWLMEDTKVWRKQRHTAARIYERLRDEYGFDGSYEIVQKKVKEIRREMKLNQEAAGTKEYLPLEWAPGTAQVDFGDVDLYLNGELVRWHFLAVSFPYSNIGYAQVFPGEAAECVCQGLKDIFAHIGGVPKRIVFDNAAGVGRKVMGAVRLTELFERFETHYKFQSTFCNPYSGHEKGNVERKVCFQRGHLFVPVPHVDDVEQFNQQLLGQSFLIDDRTHYRKEASQMDLYQEDFRNLQPLPEDEFHACRYEKRKTNKYGHIQLEGCHFYSVRPDLGQVVVTVEIGAHRVRILDHTDAVIADHRRRFGKTRTESIDQSTILGTLARKPGAWEQCGLRRVVQDPLREYIDRTSGKERRETLQILRDLNAEFGFETALAAMAAAADTGRVVNRDDASVIARRIATGGYPDVPASDPCLSAYDTLLKGGSSTC